MNFKLFTFALAAVEPKESQEDVVVQKNSPCTLKYKVPLDKRVNPDDLNAQFTRNGEQIKDFKVESVSETGEVFIIWSIDEVEFNDEGIYEVQVEFKRQKFVHKIQLAIGKFKKIGISIQISKNKNLRARVK